MRVLVFVGPSGAGKSTVVRELQRRGVIEVTRSWTTRPRRDDESGDDSTHQFVTDSEFDSLVESGYFIDTVTMFGFRYGLPGVYGRVGVVPAIVVRASLLDIVERHFPDHVVYHLESDYETAQRRLKGRGVPSEELDERLRGFADEIELGRERSDRVFDTSRGSLEVVDAIAAAIAEDFPRETARPAPLPGGFAYQPGTLAKAVTTASIIIIAIVGLGTVAYFVLIALAMASWGSSK